MDISLGLIILALLVGFYMAWNIGANDVANAMGTSVGSGALTLKQAVFIAAVLEFSGSVFLGSQVSETIQNGIVDPFYFSHNPNLFAYGMLAALLSAGVWLQIASYYGWPVSTTHSIVGAIVGFGLIYGGTGAVKWGSFGLIVSSWIFSPLLGGVVAYLIFRFLLRSILYSNSPLEQTKRLIPWLTGIVIATLAFFVFSDGLKNLKIHLPFIEAFMLALIVGALGGITVYLITNYTSESKKSFFKIGPSIKKLEANHHYNADSLAVEKMFGSLQILTACFMAFAHGANDVANAIGPLAAVLSTLENKAIVFNDSTPTWLLALGGVGIIIGLTTWGWRVIETIGKKITELDPTRGFAAEFSASLTIVIASKFGMPVSTTHTLIGCLLGVGLARGISAINLNTIKQIVISWLITVPIGAILCIIFTYAFKAILPA
ncbi:MAG: hypothetical protein K0S74_778 [Chlamydiales bacterium]|jgi:phosphate/sulfate permease|nr:hypothetical protein [Chlamydiales bacterium]